MSAELTGAEFRLIRVLCTAGPLGMTPMGASKALGLSTTTVVNLSVTVERKGFCTRERYGMRIYLRPTQVALEYVAANPSVPDRAGDTPQVVRPRRARTPG